MRVSILRVPFSFGFWQASKHFPLGQYPPFFAAGLEAIWLWVKNMYPKSTPGKWKHGPKPAVP